MPQQIQQTRQFNTS